MAVKNKFSWKQEVNSVVSLSIGVIIASLGLESFLIPNHFIDGGITGVSMLLSELFDVPLAFFLFLVNLPFVLLAKQYVGTSFAIKSGLGILAVAISLQLLEFPVATQDKLLGSIFGGFFVGAGVGLAIRGGAVLDGTEVLAVILSRRTFATVGEIILVLNVVIFSLAALHLGVESALYSALTYFAASKTIDYLLHGIEAYNGVMIVSDQNDPIRQALLQQLGRGVTAFKAKGGFSESEREVLYCVVTRLEISRLQSIVKEFDPSAFVVISPVLDIDGGVVKKRVFH